MQDVRDIPVGIGWRHPHYQELLELRPRLDFIEVHSENFFAQGGAALSLLLQARETYAVSLHGVGLALGSACGMDAEHLEQLARLVDKVDPVRVSDHAAFARGVLPGPGASTQAVHAADLLPLAFNLATLDVLCANVQRVQDRLRRPLLIENLSAYIGFKSSNMRETDFLSQLAQRTGCGLLVDVNNIYVNALNRQMQAVDSTMDPVQTCLQWLDEIAPHTVSELHVAGHARTDGMVIDDHGSCVCPEVWRIYRHAQQRFGGVAVLVEWDTDIPPLQMLLEQADQARSVVYAP